MLTETHSSWIERYALTVYFVLAFGLTWGLSILATPDFLPFQVPVAIRIFSGVMLHWGPCLAAAIVVGRASGRLGIRELFGHLRDWRVAIHWYLFVLVFPLLLRLIAVSLNILLGGAPPAFASSLYIPGIPSVLILGFVVLGIFLQAGLAEEIGWRGYALPKLQTRSNALISSLVLGLLWGFWHFHPANWPALLPIGFWYMLLVIPYTIVFTWVYNNTKSLLIAVLFHTASNTSDVLVPIVPGVTATVDMAPLIVLTILMWIVAMTLIIAFGYKTLQKEEGLIAS